MTCRKIAILAGVSALSCAGPAVTKQTIQLQSPETRHWVHDARLRDIMATLVRKSTAFWPQEIEDEKRTINRGDRAKLARLAADLATAAELIPWIISDIKMIEADRRAFRAQADTLRDQAQTLRQAVVEKDLARMRQSSAAIQTTCDSCHLRFRDVWEQGPGHLAPDNSASHT